MSQTLEQFIETILELSKSDMKKAKNDLFEYAELLDIKLKKTKSIENMIKDLKDELAKEDHSDDENIQEPEIENVYIEERDTVEDVVTVDEAAISKSKEEAVKEIKEFIEVDVSELFSFTKYLTVPYWIVDWITETKDWKEKKCPWKGSDKFMKTIMYYINKDGQIDIRETRNSSFITLK